MKKNLKQHVDLIRCILIKVVFGSVLDPNKIELCLSNMNIKESKSELSLIKRSLIFELLRVFKYAVLSAPSTKPFLSTKNSLHVSFEAFKADIGDFGEAISINKLTISLPRFLVLWLRMFPFLILVILSNNGRDIRFLSYTFIGYIFFQRIKSQYSSEVHFYGYSYVLELNALAHFLTSDPLIDFHFHETQNILDEGAAIVCNTIHFTTEIVCEYAQQNRDKYVADSYCFKTSNRDLYLALQSHKFNGKENKKKAIGIYGEGYYARDMTFVKHDVIMQGRAMENSLLKFFGRYINARKDLSFVIFPHYARGVESVEGAERFYCDLLKNDNCRLNPIYKKSYEEFENIDLGIVIRSNIFWDRAFEGHRTLMINPFMASDFLEKTVLKRAILDIGASNFESQLDQTIDYGLDFNFASGV
jgi:hypothetical protein